MSDHLGEVGMKKDVGIRELKAHASEIVRKVAEERATYTVTCRGRAVGVLSPSGSEIPSSMSGDDAWDRLERLAKAMGNRRRKRQSAVRELGEMRR
jgi:prevent-host-death family protein